MHLSSVSLFNGFEIWQDFLIYFARDAWQPNKTVQPHKHSSHTQKYNLK